LTVELEPAFRLSIETDMLVQRVESAWERLTTVKECSVRVVLPVDDGQPSVTRVMLPKLIPSLRA
jgi:hypothetical protein